MGDEKERNLTRRRALQIMAGTAVSFPVLKSGATAATNPAGQAASAVAQAPAAARFLRPEEMRTLAALTETLIPTDEHSPGARAAGVPEWIDAWLAESEEARREFWRQGLAAMDRMAKGLFGKAFAEGSEEQQVAVLEEVAAHEEHPGTLEEKFFVALKQATIDGYYNSKVGIHQDLEYQGNTALPEFKGCVNDSSE